MNSTGEGDKDKISALIPTDTAIANRLYMLTVLSLLYREHRITKDQFDQILDQIGQDDINKFATIMGKVMGAIATLKGDLDTR